MPAHQSTRVERACEICQTTFHVDPNVVRGGRGRFCSRTCVNRSRRIPLKARFLRHVSPPNENGCVLWTGAIDDKGYGRMGVERQSRNRVALAHRVAWELANGPIPDGLNVLHRCDVPPCVAIEHLFLGTTADNIADKMAKGRQARGEKAGNAKLTPELVRQIRDRYAAGGISQHKLAKESRTSVANVCLIVNRKHWRHI
jgi:hypothetical protein